MQTGLKEEVDRVQQKEGRGGTAAIRLRTGQRRRYTINKTDKRDRKD